MYVAHVNSNSYVIYLDVAAEATAPIPGASQDFQSSSGN
jgi:hypothetical protein